VPPAAWAYALEMNTEGPPLNDRGL
jgi:hypothetical protein